MKPTMEQLARADHQAKSPGQARAEWVWRRVLATRDSALAPVPAPALAWL